MKDKALTLSNNLESGRLVLALAIPAMVENILQVFIGVVDTYFVGRIGTEAIAGVGMTNLIMNLFIAFFIALGIGTTAMVSRSIGAGDNDNANTALKQSLIIATIIGLAIGVISIAFPHSIMGLLGADAELISNTLPYFLSVATPSVFLCIMMVLSSALRGAGDTKTPMMAVLIANIVNGFLDYILIFGVFDIKGLGILGAGLATTIARAVGALLLIIAINKKHRVLKIDFRAKWSIDKKIIKSIFKISLPAAIERLIMRFGQLVYGGMIINIGVSAYAAHNIAGTIETFSYLPGMAFGVAAATLVGQSLGSKQPQDAEKHGYVSYFLAASLMVTVGIVFYIFAPFLAGLFTKDETVKILVVKVLRIIALFQPFLCITLVITSALQGAGDTKFPMYSTLIGIWGVRVLGIYILGILFNLGLIGVWYAYALDVTIRGVILFIRFMRGKWKSIDLE